MKRDGRNWICHWPFFSFNSKSMFLLVQLQDSSFSLIGRCVVLCYHWGLDCYIQQDPYFGQLETSKIHTYTLLILWEICELDVCPFPFLHLILALFLRLSGSPTVTESFALSIKKRKKRGRNHCISNGWVWSGPFSKKGAILWQMVLWGSLGVVGRIK